MRPVKLNCLSPGRRYAAVPLQGGRPNRRGRTSWRRSHIAGNRSISPSTKPTTDRLSVTSTGVWPIGRRAAESCTPPGLARRRAAPTTSTSSSTSACCSWRSCSSSPGWRSRERLSVRWPRPGSCRALSGRIIEGWRAGSLSVRGRAGGVAGRRPRPSHGGEIPGGGPAVGVLEVEPEHLPVALYDAAPGDRRSRRPGSRRSRRRPVARYGEDQAQQCAEQRARHGIAGGGVEKGPSCCFDAHRPRQQQIAQRSENAR